MSTRVRLLYICIIISLQWIICLASCIFLKTGQPKKDCIHCWTLCRIPTKLTLRVLPRVWVVFPHKTSLGALAHIRPHGSIHIKVVKIFVHKSIHKLKNEHLWTMRMSEYFILSKTNNFDSHPKGKRTDDGLLLLCSSYIAAHVKTCTWTLNY